MIRLLPRKDLTQDIWKMAGPVVIGMISQTLLNVVDTAMVGRLGASALAAAGLGGILSWMVLGSLGALSIGVQAVSARRFGEGRMDDAGRVLDNGVAIALILGIVCSGGISIGMRELFQLFASDPEVAAYGRGYIFYRLLGGLPVMLIWAHRGFFNGIGETQLHMRVALLINSFNVLFNYMFIFGKLGCPEMGAAGAGLASTLGSTIGAAYFVFLAFSGGRRERFRYYRRDNLSGDVARRVLRLAAPSSLHSLLVMLGFSAFSAIVARIGTIELAATNVTITVISLSFLPGAGLGIAASSLIGQKLGEGRPDLAETYAWETVRLGFILMGTMGMIFLLFPGWIMSLFTENEAVIATGKLPLRIMGCVQVFDAAGMVLSMALEGAGMNRWVMIAEVIVNWGLFIPCTLLFAFVFGWGHTGAWVAFGLYLIVYGITVTVKFAGGSWKAVKV